MRIRGRKRRSSKRRTGIEVVALMSHSLFPTLQMESWRKELKRLKPETTRAGKYVSKLLKKEEPP